jgi:hypothetical protein
MKLFVTVVITVLAPIWTLLNAASAWANPAQIVIVRHAEKPVIGNEVTQQGCERAYLLPTFFVTNSVVNSFGTPVAIFAPQPGNADSSVRSVETIAPTAQALGLQVKDPYAKTDYTDIVQKILGKSKYDGRTILMAWEHDAIPGLAQALGVTLTAQTSTWPDAIFDQAWVINFSASGGAYLQIIPESVLPSDTPPGGAVPQSIISQCVNNNTLNALADSLATPPLPAQ